MLSIDIVIVAMYLLGFAVTNMTAFLVFSIASLASMQIANLSVNSISYEYIHFITQAMVWLIPALLLRKSIKLALCAMVMCVYEWIVAVESFVWQFITPVETMLHSDYMYIITGIHLFILSSTAKWGGEIGYTIRHNSYRSFFLSDL